MDTNSKLNNWEDPHYVHPWHDFKKEANHFALASKGEGIYIYDQNGSRHIDGPGGMWCVNLGYGRTEIADAIKDLENFNLASMLINRGFKNSKRFSVQNLKDKYVNLYKNFK